MCAWVGRCNFVRHTLTTRQNIRASDLIQQAEARRAEEFSPGNLAAVAPAGPFEGE